MRSPVRHPEPDCHHAIQTTSWYWPQRVVQSNIEDWPGVPCQWGLLVYVVLRPLCTAQHSLRLSLPHRRPSTHLGTAGGADWRFVGIEECSSDWRVLSLGGEEGFCVAQPVISVLWLPVNKFTVLTIEDPNTIDSELVDAPSLIPWVSALLCKPK